MEMCCIAVAPCRFHRHPLEPMAADPPAKNESNSIGSAGSKQIVRLTFQLAFSAHQRELIRCENHSVLHIAIFRDQ